MKFAFIAKHRGIWPAEWLCGALGVSRGGFYAWLTRPRSQRSRSDEELSAKVRASFLASDRTYGAGRVTAKAPLRVSPFTRWSIGNSCNVWLWQAKCFPRLTSLGKNRRFAMQFAGLNLATNPNRSLLCRRPSHLSRSKSRRVLSSCQNSAIITWMWKIVFHRSSSYREAGNGRSA